eukprot:600238-Rhodomonas_salina.1
MKGEEGREEEGGERERAMGIAGEAVGRALGALYAGTTPTIVLALRVCYAMSDTDIESAATRRERAVRCPAGKRGRERANGSKGRGERGRERASARAASESGDDIRRLSGGGGGGG